MARAGGAGAAMIVVAAVIVAACRQIVGISSDPPTGSSGACGGFPYAGDCASCLTSSCCDVASSCASDPSCDSYVTCFASCNDDDPACQARCTGTLTPLGDTSAIARLYACLATRCENACGLQCGVSGIIATPPAAAAGCAQCIDRSPCDTFRNCLQSSECASQVFCQQTCQGRGDCLTGCGIFANPQPTLWQSASQVFSGPCGVACAAGNDWECLGHLVTAYPRTSTVHMGLQVTDLYTKAVQQGIQVAACDVGTCGPVVADTDSNGSAQFDFPVDQQLPGPSGFVQLTSAPDAGANAIVPTRFYWGSALVGPSFYLQGIAVQTPTQEAVAYAAAGIAPLPNRAVVGLVQFDCNGALAPGIRFDVQASDTGATVIYVQGGQFSKSATMTDADGVAIVGNVPPGPVTVTASTVTPTRTVSHLGVSVEANTLVWIGLPPLQ